MPLTRKASIGNWGEEDMDEGDDDGAEAFFLALMGDLASLLWQLQNLPRKENNSHWYHSLPRKVESYMGLTRSELNGAQDWDIAGS